MRTHLSTGLVRESCPLLPKIAALQYGTGNIGGSTSLNSVNNLSAYGDTIEPIAAAAIVCALALCPTVQHTP